MFTISRVSCIDIPVLQFKYLLCFLYHIGIHISSNEKIKLFAVSSICILVGITDNHRSVIGLFEQNVDTPSFGQTFRLFSALDLCIASCTI